MLKMTTKPRYLITVSCRFVGRKTPLKKVYPCYGDPITAQLEALEEFRDRECRGRHPIERPQVTNIRVPSECPAMVVLEIQPTN